MCIWRCEYRAAKVQRGEHRAASIERRWGGGAGEAAQREGRVCSACTFENEEIGESCTMCGGSLAPVVVSIPVGSTAGSSALAAAALAAAAEVVAEAVEAEDVSWLSE